MRALFLSRDDRDFQSTEAGLVQPLMQSHLAEAEPLIEKPNVLRETGGLMLCCFKDVAKSYPDIRADDANIDAICMWMSKNPQDYSVRVAENIFGDKALTADPSQSLPSVSRFE